MNSLASYTWDVWVDWDLGYRRASFPMLRPKLAYGKHVWVNTAIHYLRTQYKLTVLTVLLLFDCHKSHPSLLVDHLFDWNSVYECAQFSFRTHGSVSPLDLECMYE